MQFSISKDQPEKFQPSVEVSGCYCEFEDRLLFLKRHPRKSQGNTWGIPGGKMEDGENPRETVIRETKEEVGLDINHESLLTLGTLYCQFPHVDFVFHLFCKKFSTLPEIELGLEEHLEAKWVTYKEALELPLIIGGKEVLNYYNRIRFCKNVSL